MSQQGTYLSINPSMGVVQTLTGNVGGAISPIAGNINIVGAGGITVTGTPGTLTITAAAAGVTSITGTANQITASAPTGAVTLSIPVVFIAPGSIEATTTATAVTFNTKTATNNLSINGSTITSAGTNPNVGLDIVAKGTGSLTFTTDTTGEIVFRGLTAGFVVSTWHQAQNSVQTVNATPTVIISIVVPDSHMVTIKSYVNGFQSDFTDCVGGEIMITAYRPAGGNVTLVGGPFINVNFTDLVDTSDVDAQVDIATQTARILVIGVAAQTWNWVTTYFYMFTKDNT